MDVGVLEDQPHFAVEAETVFARGDRRDIQAQRSNATMCRADDSVEELE